MSSLNPGAQEFIPRQERIRYDPIQNYQPSNNSQQQPPQQLPNNIPNGIGDNAETMEDYIALSYLKEFLTQMANNPSMYEPSIAEVTSLISSYLDEDECVLELIVNQIVDQVRPQIKGFSFKFQSYFFSLLSMVTCGTMAFVCVFTSFIISALQELVNYSKIFSSNG